MTEKPTDLDLRRKKALWRATHRGMKEMDLMLGGYAQKNLANMTSAQLAEFEQILNISDSLLNDWLTDKLQPPEGVQTPMFAEIKQQSFVASDYKKL